MKKRKQISLVALVLSVVTMFSGCGKSLADEAKEYYINDHATVYGTLDAISDETYIDDKIETLCELDENQKNLEELDEMFNTAFDEKRYDICNDMLYEIGDLILRAKIASVYGVAILDVEDLKYSANNISGKIRKDFNKETQTYDYEEFDYETRGDISNLVINTCRASLGNCANDTIKDVYKAMIRSLLQSEEIVKLKVPYGKKAIQSNFNDQKGEDYKSYVYKINIK